MLPFLRPSFYFKTRPPSCALGTSFYTVSKGSDLMTYVSDNYTSYSAPSRLITMPYHIEDPTAPIDTVSESLAEETGLPYIHFYTPIRSHRSKSVTHSMDQDASSDCDSSSDDAFTEEEHTRYMKQLEEGYDITSDSRYNLWLKKRSELVRAQSDVPNNLLLGEAIKS